MSEMAIAGLLLLLGRIAGVLPVLLEPWRQRRLWKPIEATETTGAGPE